MLTHVKSGIPVVAISVIAAFWMAPVLAVAAPPDWGKAGQGQDTGEGAPPPQPSTPTYEKPTRPAPSKQRPQAPRPGSGSPQAPQGPTSPPGASWGSMSKAYDVPCPLPPKTATAYTVQHVQKPADYYVLRDASERIVTSIRIQKGATVCVRAEGKMNFGGGFAGIGDLVFDPDGVGEPAPSDFRAPGLRKFSLACGIQPFQANAVSRWYQCGTATTFTADQEGWLVLLQNDSAVRDNRGQWTVRSLVVTQPYWAAWPPAQTPILDAVLAIPATGGSLTQVSAGTNGWYEVLPIGSPSGGVRLQLHTPFPASLKVDIDGTDLAKDKSPGYYANVTNDNYSTTGVARWAVNVIPQPEKNKGSKYEIGVKSVIGNQTSDRLVITLAQPPCQEPHETFQAGEFTPVAQTSPLGFTHKPDSTGRYIEIWKGTTKIHSHSRQGQGTWEVFYNQRVPESALILERGVPMQTPSAHQEIFVIKLGSSAGSGRQVGSDRADAFRGTISQSPDGKVFAVGKGDNLNTTNVDVTVGFYKASPACAQAQPPLGTAMMSDCDVGWVVNPTASVRMESNNLVWLQCSLDEKKKPRVPAQLR